MTAPLFTLANGFERKAIMNRAWAFFRADVADRRPASFGASLKRVWEAARWERDAALYQAALDAASPAEERVMRLEDQLARADYIENHFQRVETVERLEKALAAARAAVEDEKAADEAWIANLEYVEAYAAQSGSWIGGVVAPERPAPEPEPAPKAAPANIPPAYQLACGGTGKRVDAQTAVAVFQTLNVSGPQYFARH